MRKADMSENGVRGIIKVVEIRETPHWKGATNVSAHYIYKIDDDIFKNHTKIMNDEIEVGTCYKMTYSTKNPKAVDIMFRKPCGCPEALNEY